MKNVFIKAAIMAVITAAGLMIATSCVKRTNRGDTLTASFSVSSRTIYDGDEFHFTVKTNREKLRVVDFSFPLHPDMVKEGQVYSVSDGEWTVSQVVSVPDIQRVKLSITVEDVATGETLTFSETITAYRRAKVNVEILNPVLKRTANVNDDYPTIIDGDDFQMRVKSSISRLKLIDYRCALNDGTLHEGAEYDTNRDGEVFITIPAVNVTSDNLKTPLRLSLTFEDPETGASVVCEAFYYTCLRFEASATLMQEVVRNGDDLVLTISANRDKFKYNSSTKLPWFNPLIPSTVTLTADKTYQVSIPAVSITFASEGDISFSFTDDQYTSEERIVKLHYVTVPDIVISEENINIGEGEVVMMIVSLDKTRLTGRFHVSVSGVGSGGIVFYAPSSQPSDLNNIPDSKFSPECDINNNILIVKGIQPGRYTLRITDLAPNGRYNDFEAFVKENIVILLRGKFMDQLSISGFGFYGLPDEITAELMTYKISGSTTARDLSQYTSRVSVANSVSFSSISAKGKHSVKMEVSFARQVSSCYFYASAVSYPGGVLEWATNYGYANTGFLTLPSENNLKHYTEDSISGGTIVSCSQLSNYMSMLDAKCNVIGYNSPDEELKFGSIIIKLSDYSFEFDESKYRLKYVVNLITYRKPFSFEATAWWMSIDDSPVVTEL